MGKSDSTKLPKRFFPFVVLYYKIYIYISLLFDEIGHVW